MNPLIEDLVERHVEVVDDLAGMFYGRLSSSVRSFIEIGDLRGVGYLALMGVADRFKPDSGATFRTYMGHRVVGAMRDEVDRTINIYMREKPSGLLNGEKARGLGQDNGWDIPYMDRVRSQLAGELLAQIVVKAIHDLPEDQRDLALGVLSGNTLLDTAKRLGINEKRAYWLLNRRVRPALRERAEEVYRDYLEAVEEEHEMPAKPKASHIVEAEGGY